MANTYTQIYVQIVFPVQGRQSLIRPAHNDEIQNTGPASSLDEVKADSNQ